MGLIHYSNLVIAKDVTSLTSTAAMSDMEHYSMSMEECLGPKQVQLITMHS